MNLFYNGGLPLAADAADRAEVHLVGIPWKGLLGYVAGPFSKIDLFQLRTCLGGFNRTVAPTNAFRSGFPVTANLFIIPRFGNDFTAQVAGQRSHIDDMVGLLHRLISSCSTTTHSIAQVAQFFQHPRSAFPYHGCEDRLKVHPIYTMNW